MNKKGNQTASGNGKIEHPTQTFPALSNKKVKSASDNTG